MTVLDRKFTSGEFLATYQVDEQHAGTRIDQFLLTHMKGHSREQIKKKIADGTVILEGRPGTLKPSTKLLFNDIINISIPKTIHEDEWWQGKLIELDTQIPIIDDHKDFLIINKPPFMSTHPTGRHMFHCATVLLEEKFNMPIRSVHRIDRETSGILIMAKNMDAATELSQNFEYDRVRKCYFFIAKFFSEGPGFTREVPCSIDAYERQGGRETGLKKVVGHCFPRDSAEGQEAHTHFKIIAKNSQYAVGLAFPTTGRTHQIRLHAMYHQLPLLGDKIYMGGYEMFQRFKDNLSSQEDHELMEIPRQALHAFSLNFPYQNKHLTYVAPPAKDLLQWMKEKWPELDQTKLLEEMQRLAQDYFAKGPA